MKPTTMTVNKEVTITRPSQYLELAELFNSTEYIDAMFDNVDFDFEIYEDECTNYDTFIKDVDEYGFCLYLMHMYELNENCQFVSIYTNKQDNEDDYGNSGHYLEGNDDFTELFTYIMSTKGEISVYTLKKLNDILIPKFLDFLKENGHMGIYNELTEKGFKYIYSPNGKEKFTQNEFSDLPSNKQFRVHQSGDT